MKCKYNFEDIIKYTDNTMCEEERKELENHINSCEVCRNTYTALLLTDKFSNSEAYADKNFHKDIINKLDKERYLKNNLVLFKFRKAIKPALSIAACLTILFTSFMFRQQLFQFVNDTYTAVTNKANNHDIPEPTEDKKYSTILHYYNLGICAPTITAVTVPCTGKTGPGPQFKDVIDLEYGKLIWVLDSNEENTNWCRAKLMPDDSNTEFWINFENIDLSGKYACFLDNLGLSMSEASIFNYVISNETQENDVQLKMLPDSSSDSVADVKNGDLIRIIRQDSKWSLVKKLTDTEKDFTCYTGWIANDNYKLCKKGISTNQGFIQKNTKVYERADQNSAVLKSFQPTALMVPVVIESVNGEWTKISNGYNEFTGKCVTKADSNEAYKYQSSFSGWVKSNELITSFDGIDLDALINPEIDKVDFAGKIRKEILSSTEIKLNAYDIEKDIILSQTQKEALAQSLTSIDNLEFSEGGIQFEREAIYPFYSLEWKVGSTSELSNYQFVVAGEDRVAIVIPSERYNYYPYLNYERVPVSVIKVSKGFVEYIKSLIPTPANDNKNNINYLFNAQKVVFGYDSGTGPQIGKCVRAIKSLMGNEIVPNEITKRSLDDFSSFDFIFADSSTLSVLIYSKYIYFNNKWYSVKDNPKNIVLGLLAGSF